MQWLSDNFISFVDGVAFGLLLFTIAIGLSLVLGVLDVLNLAHGALYLVGTYVAVLFFTGATVSIWAFLAALLVAAVVGLGAGTGLAAMVRPLTGRGHLDQALLTLGVALVVSDLVSAYFGNDVHAVPAPGFLAGSPNVAGFTYPTYRLAVILVGLGLAVLVYLVVERTRLGALARATVVDAPMVRALGVDTRPFVAGIFAFGTVLASVGGVLGAPILGAYPGLDQYVLLLGLVVVVLGGVDSVLGTLLGALTIGQVEVLGVSLMPRYASFLVFATMVVVLLVRPGNRLRMATS
jgi:branched-subunit amino acid ABC-type transport system permease component